MNQIQEIRKRSGLSQTQFSYLLGIPVKTIQNWEQGRTKPPVWILELIEKRIEGKI